VLKEGDEHYVTLGDVASGININKELVRLGLATTHARDAPKRFAKPIAQLQQAQDEAKRARLCLWRFGDLLDQEDEADE
jgi:endonuclease YncB( thermonuclease family)